MHVYNISIFYLVVTHNINKFKRRNKHRNIKQTWKLTKFWICFIISWIITRKQYDESVKRTAANHLSFSFYKQNKKYKKKTKKQNKKRKAVNVTTEIGLLYSIHISLSIKKWKYYAYFCGAYLYNWNEINSKTVGGVIWTNDALCVKVLSWHFSH